MEGQDASTFDAEISGRNAQIQPDSETKRLLESGLSKVPQDLVRRLRGRLWGRSVLTIDYEDGQIVNVEFSGKDTDRRKSGK